MSIRNVAPVNVDVTVTDNAIRLTYPDSFDQFASGTFNGYVFTDFTGTIPDFSAVSIDSATNLPGLDASRVSFDANDIFINVSGLAVPHSGIVIQVDVSTVPEPGSMALIAGGIVCISGYYWKRRRFMMPVATATRGPAPADGSI